MWLQVKLFDGLFDFGVAISFFKALIDVMWHVSPNSEFVLFISSIQVHTHTHTAVSIKHTQWRPGSYWAIFHVLWMFYNGKCWYDIDTFCFNIVKDASPHPIPDWPRIQMSTGNLVEDCSLSTTLYCHFRYGFINLVEVFWLYLI